MKFLFVLVFALSSLAASAHGIRRLTTQKCESKDLRSSISVFWDSSHSIVGPKEIIINGLKVKKGGMRMELGDTYTRYEGKIENGDSFEFTSLKEKINKTKLLVNGRASTVYCKTKTRFGVY